MEQEEFLRLWDPKGHKKQGPKKAPESLRVFSFKLNVKTHSAFSKEKKRQLPMAYRVGSHCFQALLVAFYVTKVFENLKLLKYKQQ